MKKIYLKRVAALLLAFAVAFSFTACGASDDGGSGGDTAAGDGDASGVTKITFAYRNTSTWPSVGEDENGNPSGYDIEILRLIDEKLDDYEFEYVGTSYDDAYIGLEAGNYQAALTNAFWTEERAEKYLISEEAQGASVLILALRNENGDISNLQELSDAGLKLAPLLAGNGMYYVVKQYNEENPDHQVEITTTDDSTYVAGSVEELVAGKYDAVIYVKSTWDGTVVSEEGDNHIFLDQVTYHEFTLALTYPMFSKTVGEDFLAQYTAALRELKEDGTASALSQEFYGYDIWNYEYQ